MKTLLNEKDSMLDWGEGGRGRVANGSLKGVREISYFQGEGMGPPSPHPTYLYLEKATTCLNYPPSAGEFLNLLGIASIVRKLGRWAVHHSIELFKDC